jgi:hypothetical protein
VSGVFNLSVYAPKGRFLLPIAGTHGKMIANGKELTDDEASRKHMGQAPANPNHRPG